MHYDLLDYLTDRGDRLVAVLRVGVLHHGVEVADAFGKLGGGARKLIAGHAIVANSCLSASRSASWVARRSCNARLAVVTIASTVFSMALVTVCSLVSASSQRPALSRANSLRAR
ncbi:hypothetical protein [Rhodopseudomonas palustris]|uniref:Uncharacterized protein n=1 Tax=Rhodopseudomonas palustris TaxID=1076 RepID=A0A418VHD1_RHOPL|nr:hypothetical protein [Rhodopseudomonas palustris]RJF75461.1 hypothetical protein D4Q52_09790 [Rhodopseudomonas palustris]